MNAANQVIQKESEHISITDVATQIRKDSEGEHPITRELELNAMLRLCELMSQTGVIRIPAIIYGAVLAERDRVAILAEQASIG